MDLTTRRTQATRLDIEQAALELFEEVGYEGVTVEQIAARTGMSTRTFYRYYKGKDDVLAARLTSHGQVIADGIASRGDLPPLEAVAHALLDAVAAEGADERLLRRIIVLSWAESDLHARWLAAGRRTQDTLTEVLGRQPGTGSAARAEVLAGAVVAALQVALKSWAEEGGSLRGHTHRCLEVLAPLFVHHSQRSGG